MDGPRDDQWGAIRIGLAHGAVTNFSEDGEGVNLIDPNRATRAGLAYLALGDWHGAVEIGPRTRYSGTPEPDRFKHDRPGEALVVSIEGASALPQVTRLETGSFLWRTLELELLDGDDAIGLMDSYLPATHLRRRSLIRLIANGRVRLDMRSALSAAVERIRPDFAYLEFEDAGLSTECEASDLDAIARTGALRDVAEALYSEARDTSRSSEEREVASAALNRLYALAQAVSR